MSYYCVKVKCGHVGDGYYIPIDFAVAADSKVEAIEIAKNTPRVKHTKEGVILNIREITYSEYIQIIDSHKADPYLNAHCDNDIVGVDLSDRIKKEPKQHIEKKYHGNKLINARKASYNKKKHKNNEMFEFSENKEYMEVFDWADSYNGDLKTLNEELEIQEKNLDETLVENKKDAILDEEVLEKYLLEEGKGKN